MSPLRIGLVQSLMVILKNTKKGRKKIGHSIKNQINYAINKCWNEGTQKRNYKMQEGKDMSHQVFSYSESFRLKDVAKDFSNYLKREYPTIRQIKDISPNVIQRFLDSKTHCSKQTITTYYNSLKKIDMILNHTYKTYSTKFIDIIKPNTTIAKDYQSGKGVANQMSSSDFNKLLEYCKNNPSQSSYVIQLQKYLGIRVNELTHGIKIENIDFANNKLIITNTKGGKELIRDLTPQSSTLLKEIISKKYEPKGERLFTIENNSVNKYLARTESKIGIEGKYSIHNIRSRIAQDYFDNLREQGKSKNEALKETSLFLNHRTEREQMLTQSYINIH